jgi:hypothetical protein
MGDGGISSLNRSARTSRQILIGINSVIYNYIPRIDSKKNTQLRKLKCGMWAMGFPARILGSRYMRSCQLIIDHIMQTIMIYFLRAEGN